MRNKTNNGKNILDSDNIGKLLVKLSLPAFIGMFVMTLYNVVDTMFIGRYVGPLGIGGLSIIFPFQMLSMGLGQMFGMGGASLISRLIGSNRIQRAEHALGNSTSPVIIIGLVTMAVGLVNPDFWLKLLGASDTILPYAREYMVVILIGMVPATLSMSLSGLIRAEGNAMIPMTGMIGSAILNIILDAIFIIPLDLGITGAALATVISQVIATIYFLGYYLSGKSFLKIRLRNLLLDFGVVKDILAIGVASFARTLATSLTAVFVNRLLVSYGGDIAISAYGVLNRMMMFFMMPAMVLGQGMQPILGFNYGAKRYDRALKVIKIAMTYSTIISSVIFVIIYFSPGPIISIFSEDAELIALGIHISKRMFLVWCLLGFMMVGSLVFQSIGKAVQSFLTSIARSFMFILPLVLILPHFMGLEGIFLAYPIADTLTFFLTVGLLVPVIKEIRRAERAAGSNPVPIPAKESVESEQLAPGKNSGK